MTRDIVKKVQFRGRTCIEGWPEAQDEKTWVGPDGKKYDRIPYNRDDDGICHDCFAKDGELHVSGCDMERCPRCSGQALCCDCNYEEEEDEEG